MVPKHGFMTFHRAPVRGSSAAVALLCAGMVMSGTIGYFVVESGAPPLVVVFWRCVIGACALLVVIGARPGTRQELRATVRSRTGIVLAGSGGLLVANWVLVFTAYEHLSIGVATVIFHVEPFILLGLGALFLHERLNRRTLGWAGLGFLGIVAVAQPWASVGQETGALLIGVGLTLVAATAYAGSIVVVRAQQGRVGAAPSPLVIVTIQLIAGAVITSPSLLVVPHQVSAPGWAHLVVLGLVNTALMYLIIYTAYPRLGTATVGVLAFVYPAAAVVVDLIVYGTAITVAQWVGFIAITAAGIGQVLTTPQSPQRPQGTTSNHPAPEHRKPDPVLPAKD